VWQAEAEQKLPAPPRSLTPCNGERSWGDMLRCWYRHLRQRALEICKELLQKAEQKDRSASVLSSEELRAEVTHL